MISLKVLAYVHTFNDAEVIDATIKAICCQTYPITEILLIDNASVDGTLDRTFPDNVTIIRNSENLGTSGAVAAGMEYALAHGYDWIYILDADSTPEPKAIENLVRCYLSLGPELQASTWWLSSLLKDEETGFLHHGCVFTRRGVKVLNPPPQPSHYRCDLNIWSGSFYRLDAVKKVGLPDRNYVLDWGDMIYGYEGMIRGYTGFADQSSIVIHHLHVFEGAGLRALGSRLVTVYCTHPIRSYYWWRNSIYFWIYKNGAARSAIPIMFHSMRLGWWLIRVVLFVRSPGPALRACFRGTRDGVNGRLEKRF
ncbi:MAG: glycosyltransferase [Candidatus Binataceae bacterium]